MRIYQTERVIYVSDAVIGGECLCCDWLGHCYLSIMVGLSNVAND
jgi:hypothetical protein